MDSSTSNEVFLEIFSKSRKKHHSNKKGIEKCGMQQRGRDRKAKKKMEGKDMKNILS